MKENNKIFEIIKDIKAGKVTLAEVRGEISELDWKTLEKIMELNVNNLKDNTYLWDWTRSLDLIENIRNKNI